VIAHTLLPDDVWAQLDPDAGRLPRRTRRRIRVAAIAAAAFLVIIGLGWQWGAVVPRVGGSGHGAMSGPGVMAVTVDVRNTGWTGMRVVGVGRSGPGLRLTRVDGTVPADLGDASSASYTLYYDVTNCAALPTGPWPVPVRIQRPWGVWTGWIGVEPMVPMGDSPNPPPPGMRSFTGRDPYAKEWQVALANMTCTPQKPIPASTP
jgi:hypothetical protein